MGVLDLILGKNDHFNMVEKKRFIMGLVRSDKLITTYKQEFCHTVKTRIQEHVD